MPWLSVGPVGNNTRSEISVDGERLDGRLEFGHREPLRQPCQHALLHFVQHRQVVELRREEGLVIGVRRTHPGLGVRADRIEFDRSGGIDDTRAELD
jgi:hypothetical protein